MTVYLSLGAPLFGQQFVCAFVPAFPVFLDLAPVLDKKILPLHTLDLPALIGLTFGFSSCLDLK